MAYTQVEIESRITALETAFDRHELTVEYSDRRVTYASTADIERRINYWRGLLGTVTRPARRKQSLAVASKGLA